MNNRTCRHPTHDARPGQPHADAPTRVHRGPSIINQPPTPLQTTPTLPIPPPQHCISPLSASRESHHQDNTTSQTSDIKHRGEQAAKVSHQAQSIGRQATTPSVAGYYPSISDNTSVGVVRMNGLHKHKQLSSKHQYIDNNRDSTDKPGAMLYRSKENNTTTERVKCDEGNVVQQKRRHKARTSGRKKPNKDLNEQVTV